MYCVNGALHIYQTEQSERSRVLPTQNRTGQTDMKKRGFRSSPFPPSPRITNITVRTPVESWAAPPTCARSKDKCHLTGGILNLGTSVRVIYLILRPCRPYHAFRIYMYWRLGRCIVDHQSLKLWRAVEGMFIHPGKPTRPPTSNSNEKKGFPIDSENSTHEMHKLFRCLKFIRTWKSRNEHLSSSSILEIFKLAQSDNYKNIINFTSLQELT